MDSQNVLLDLAASIVIAIFTFIIEEIVEDGVYNVLFDIIYKASDSIEQSGLSTGPICAFLIRLIPPLVNGAIAYAGIESLQKDRDKNTN